MQYRLLDTINSNSAKESFRIIDARSVPAEHTNKSSESCRRFCGYKGAKVSDANPTLENCRECHEVSILTGALVSESGIRFEIINGRPKIATRVVSEHKGFRIVETDCRIDPRCIPFLENHPNALIYHHPEWLQVLRDEYDQQLLVLAAEDDEDRIAGVLPLFFTRGLPFNVGVHQVGRRLSSLPRTPIAGPVATTPEIATALLAAAAKIASANDGMNLQIKSQDSLPKVETLIETDWRPTYVMALPGPGEQLRFGDAKNRHNLKWAVNKATKLGLQTRLAESDQELRAWYRLYLDVMRRNFVPARPLRLFESMWRNMRPNGHMELLLAERFTGSKREMVAGSIFLKFGSTVFYAFTGCMTGNLTMHANDLMVWNAIHDAAQEGFHYFDFGECPEEHPELVRFKCKWGAIPRPLYRYYLADRYSNPLSNGTMADHSKRKVRKVAEQLWQRTPLGITAVVGDFAYSWL